MLSPRKLLPHRVPRADTPMCYVSCTYVNLFRLPLIRSNNKTRQWLANDHFYAPFFSNYSSSHDQISLKCTCLGAMAGLVRCWNLQVTVECTSRDALICLRPNHSKTGNGMNFSFPTDTCIYKKLAWWLFGCPINMVVVVASQRRGPRFNPVSSHIFGPTTTMIMYLIWGTIK